MPEIIYRADGGHPIGMGHVLRALRLADQWSVLCPAIVVRLLTRDEPSVRQAIETSPTSAVCSPNYLFRRFLGVCVCDSDRERNGFAREMPCSVENGFLHL